MSGSPQFPKLRVGGDASRTQDNISQQVAPVAKAVAATPMLDGTLPAWVALSPQNGFANAGGTNIASIARHKDALGYVHLQGRASHAAGTAGSTTLATLPAGERPSRTQFLVVNGTALTYQVLQILPTGEIQNGIAVAAGGTVDLAGSFLADG